MGRTPPVLNREELLAWFLANRQVRAGEALPSGTPYQPPPCLIMENNSEANSTPGDNYV